MFHEEYGKLAERNIEVTDAYQRTLGLLKAVKDNEIDISRITVNEDGWVIADELIENTYEAAKQRILDAN